MSNLKKHVWFMRHGKINFDYENCAYDELMEMLSNGSKKPLLNRHGIKFTFLPPNVELVCHSPEKRASDTAAKLKEKLEVGSVEEIDLLREVKFDKDIIEKEKYTSLEDSRPFILKRWFYNENKSESFKASTARVARIEKFLQNRQERSIILVTHGWFLRLLKLYFVNGKRNGIDLEDLLNVKPIALGQFFEATLEPERSTRSIIYTASALSAK